MEVKDYVGIVQVSIGYRQGKASLASRDVDDAGLRDGGPTGHRDGRAGQFGSRYGGPVLPRRMRTGGGS